MTAAAFVPVDGCWVCGGADLAPIHTAIFDFSEYADQDPELASYTGAEIEIRRCRACGFAQPAGLPSLPRYFARMYDQHWAPDWVAAEHEGTYKDVIFRAILRRLDAEVPRRPRRLLDVGAHAGRFLRLAAAQGWTVEGLELNPRTARFAAGATGAPVHTVGLRDFDPGLTCYHAVTLVDVLEHIPEPVTVLHRVRDLLSDGGWVAVKVPNAPNQLLKERIRRAVTRRGALRVADNLVHVNHFSPRSLRIALERAGFSRVSITVGAPELPPHPTLRGRASRGLRRLSFAAATALPLGGRSPLAFNLQAYGQR